MQLKMSETEVIEKSETCIVCCNSPHPTSSILILRYLIVLLYHLMTQMLCHFDNFLVQMSWYKFMEDSICLFLCVAVCNLTSAPKLLGPILQNSTWEAESYCVI
jgi:hypothetical protein